MKARDEKLSGDILRTEEEILKERALRCSLISYCVKLKKTETETLSKHRLSV